MMMGQVFLSYARGTQNSGGNGENRAEQLKEIVEYNHALSAWFDQTEIRGSQEWQKLIHGEIQKSCLFILVLTPEILESTFVQWELAIAEANRVPILPVRFNVEMKDIQALPYGPLILAKDVKGVGPKFSKAKKEDLFVLIQEMAGMTPVPYPQPAESTEPVRPPLEPTKLQPMTQNRPTPDATTMAAPIPKRAPHDTCRVAAMANFNGGVGKTTLTALLSIWLARQAGAKVLVIDLDPLGHLTDCLQYAPHIPELADRGRTALSLFEPFRVPTNGGSDPLLSLPVTAFKSAGRLDLLVGDMRLMKLAQVDAALRGVLVHNFRRALARLKAEYSHILIDCGPGATLLNICAMDGADEIVTPARAQPTATRGLVSMLRVATNVGIEAEDKLRPVFNMVRNIESENAYLHGFYSDPAEHFSAELGPLAGRAFAASVPLSASMTDPIGLVAGVLKNSGDFEVLGKDRSRVEAFCLEYAGPVKSESSEADEQAHVFGGPDTTSPAVPQVAEPSVAPAPPQRRVPRPDWQGQVTATAPLSQPPSMDMPPPQPAPPPRLDQELERLSELKDRLRRGAPVETDLHRSQPSYTLEQKILLAQQRTGLDRRTFLDRIVEAGVAQGLEELAPGQRTLQATREWLSRGLSDAAIERLIRVIADHLAAENLAYER